MEREGFLDGVAKRLGRGRQESAPARTQVKAPWPLLEGSMSARFVAELQRVAGTSERADSRESLLSCLRRAIEVEPHAPIVAERRSVFESLGLDTSTSPFERVSFFGDDGCDTAESFRGRALAADLGLTTCVCAIATTGTLLLTASPASPRSISLLPRRHVAIVRESQIVADLEVALAQATRTLPPHARMPSALFCITGPSRTSDIENDLSIGVHGPADVHVILYDGAEA